MRTPSPTITREERSEEGLQRRHAASPRMHISMRICMHHLHANSCSMPSCICMHARRVGNPAFARAWAPAEHALLRSALQVRTQIVQILCPRQPLQRACTRNRSEERVRIQTWKTMENGGRPVRLCWTTTWVVVLQAASPCLEASRGDKIRRKNGVDTRL